MLHSTGVSLRSMAKQRKISAKVLALPIEDRAEIALKVAVKEAIADRLKKGLSVYVLEDGKVVDLKSKKASLRRRSTAKQRNSK